MARKLLLPIMLLVLFILSREKLVGADTSQSILPPSTASADELVVPGEMVVKLKNNFQVSALTTLNDQFKVDSIEPVFPAATDSLAQIYRLKVAADADVWSMALAYAQHPAVAYAEPNLRAWLFPSIEARDPLLRRQWNLNNVGQTGGTPDADVDAREAAVYYIQNPPVYNPVVAVLDTGVDYNHPDLAAAMLPGYDFVSDDADPMDTNGHGTGTSSIIGARYNNGIGIAGLCPNCSILPVRVGTWVVHFGSIEVAEGIFYAADPQQGNADIISMSLGGTCSDLWTDAVDYAYGQDVFMVAAAGNYTVVVVYPAAYPRVMVAGATDHNDDIPWWVPSIGSIDMYAPGVDVPVADWGGSYDTMTGTSSATPHIAATAALLLGQNPALTTPDMRQIIVNTGDQIGNFLFPHSRLNVAQAIVLADTPPANPYNPPHEDCAAIPIGPYRAAFAQAVNQLDAQLGGQPLADLLQRHRIQIGALLMTNADLLQLAQDVTKDTTVWASLLSGLAGKANPDLRYDLLNLLSTLPANE